MYVTIRVVVDNVAHCIVQELHEIKYMDILFDQSEVFHTSKKANESSSEYVVLFNTALTCLTDCLE